MMIRIARLVGLAFLLAMGLAAQETETARPLSEPELIQLVNAKTPEEKIIAEVKSRGISFRLSPETEDGLKKLKLNALIAALNAPASMEIHANVPAQVTLDGESRGALSDRGEMSLTGLAAGDHVLQLQAENYVGDSRTVFLKPGETQRLEVELRPAVTSTPGPLGSRVSVQAGTTADAALAELEFIKDAPTRLVKLQQMVERFDASPVALLGYSLFQEAYLAENRYDDAIAAGQEIVRRDPRNFAARVRMVRASVGKGDLAAAFDTAAQAHQLLEAAPAAPAPEGVSAEAWRREKQQLLQTAQADWRNLAYDVFVAVTQVPDPAQRLSFLGLFLQLFPKSDYESSAIVQAALAAQQKGDLETMMRWADQGLEANPNDGVLMMLVGDVLSERGQDLERARTLAQRMLETLASDPNQVRPQGLPEEQWTGLQQLWQGTAHTILGQVLMHQETATAPAGMAKTRQAIEEFRAASPLLKAETQSYARNLFRLGYAYAKLGEMVPARDALTEVMSLETPYKQVAAPILEQVQKRLSRR